MSLMFVKRVGHSFRTQIAEDMYMYKDGLDVRPYSAYLAVCGAGARGRSRPPRASW